MVHSGAILNNFKETAEKMLKTRRKMVHSDAIWNDVLEGGTA